MKQKKEKLRILVLTLAPWNYKNCTGSTQSSIFEGMDNIEVANIYCRYGEPDNKIVSRYFQITEKSMIKSLITHIPSGYERFYNPSASNVDFTVDILNDGENKIFNRLRILRFQIFYWAQELIWRTNLWKSKELKTFVQDFNPDVLWIPIYYTCYTNNLALYIQKLTNKPMACYISDDNYTLKQFSLSPFYWVDRFIKRPKIKKIIQKCNELYVITAKQKEEYDQLFNINSKILRKGASFKESLDVTNVHEPIRLVFMGSLGFNRWKSLVDIINTLARLNTEGIKSFLSIYTMTPLTDKIKSKLEVKGVSKIQPTISNDEIDATFRKNDILIHCEPTDLKNKLYYRLSFSTKLVDYFRNGRCIVAYGGHTGSMDYLQKFDCGIVIESKKALYYDLKRILTRPDLIQEYSKKAYDVGKLNHQINTIQTNLYNDLTSLGE